MLLLLLLLLVQSACMLNMFIVYTLSMPVASIPGSTSRYRNIADPLRQARFQNLATVVNCNDETIAIEFSRRQDCY